MGIDIEEERSKVIGRFELELIGNHSNTKKKLPLIDTPRFTEIFVDGIVIF